MEPGKEAILPEEAEDQKEDSLASSSPKGELVASSETGGWTDWSSKWFNVESASSLMDKAVLSVTAAVSLAKSKSSEAYGLVSKDLEEVSSQAASLVGSTASSIKQTLEVVDKETDVMAEKAVDSVKKSMSSMWRLASGYALQMFSEDDLGSEALLVGSDHDPPMPLDRLQAQLLALSADPETFLSDPDPMDDLSKEWSSYSPNLDKRQGEMSDLMVSNMYIHRQYSALVPDKVSHGLFWRRYLFKVHLIEVQETKRQALKARAAGAHSSDDILAAWDEEEVGKGCVIPPDVQDRLLSDYEREMIDKRLKKAADGCTVANDPDSPSTDKDDASSDDWEKLSTGEKSPRKS